MRGSGLSVCGCLSCALYQGPGLQPRHVPWLGIELATPWFEARTQYTELHQPGHEYPFNLHQQKWSGWLFLFKSFHVLGLMTTVSLNVWGVPCAKFVLEARTTRMGCEEFAPKECTAEWERWTWTQMSAIWCVKCYDRQYKGWGWGEKESHQHNWGQESLSRQHSP